MFAKVTLLATLALLAWAMVAWPLGAHGQKAFYRVRPYDTLWTIASSHYAGDVRDGVWRIEAANHLAGPTIRPGQLLLLP
jgi:nucleoid-associated protein YgaU